MLLLATLACTVTVELACAPYCEDRGAVCPSACSLDSTRWVRATYSGDCGGTPAWSVAPGHPDGWINGSHRDPDAVECGEDEFGGTLWCASRAWIRGPSGRYVVRATAPGGDFGELEIVLPEGAP